MTYEEALAFIESMPKFSPTAMASGDQRYDLQTITYLLNQLGNPQDQLHFVHIAGTNGKGSTSAMIQSILTAAGLKTGLYTSPALERFTERIRIDDREIEPEELGEIVGTVYEKYHEMELQGLELPSEFEVVCAAAFLYFLKQQCDVVVLEVGMGGRKDATNVIGVPDLAVITTISLDHTSILGDSLPAIAKEKAGIIKQGGQVLLYPQSEEVEEVFRETCREKNAALQIGDLPEKVNSRTLQGQNFDLRDFKDLTIPLLGNYQVNNAAMAVRAACILREKKGYPIPDEAVRRGLAEVVWPGRFELMHTQPAVIVDGGHNIEGARVLRESLQRYFPDRKIRFVTGVMADKDYDAMTAEMIPLAEQFYCMTPDNPRALPAADFAAFLESKGAKAAACDSVTAALSAAMEHAGADDVICVFGSLYCLGEVRAYFQK